ncbi:MAG TPA: transposase [Candidatus Mucispirillum faecigallinarum]|uniref:Transposase n=1 Tax=Candidatus Mucispirillum faecigallinarum TaxID=2838699 RepID=A0A9D2GWY3_9BACT|nr:transposase [Candidatus Mucispirillum faecigallinarum]
MILYTYTCFLKAISFVFTGTSLQRCIVHFMSNILSKIPKTINTK